MLDKSFNKNIRAVLKKLKFPVYVVHAYKKKFCTCNKTNSEEGDIDCPKCLGTGRKIRIYKVDAAYIVDQINTRNSGIRTKQAIITYFFDGEDTPEGISTGDLIVHGNELNRVQGYRNYRSDSDEILYREVDAINRQVNRDKFLKNFYALIEEDMPDIDANEF